ncbi:MAG: hypothetical protein NZ849_10480 [Meiothermus sp.]|uniref:hypothetical protein n=1 Tax=Meiothermus sp. TaxID=1955249 RepID=UPI0025D8EC90|nr:hypothetical protein [Meiothermus sp.]MCS7058487.1 hypothetical protein [Meiothermus sp.]MCS7195315.1 hypothetical protein [Meiothermus sp.]MCX7741015.1 hypothetical protein [Meiothermus sp.]MDW8091660.1 hypothetical protein [Meiothermus sp.]MDW8480976.1 hypothetical protein [Meiothermus sp.]
MNLFQRHSPPDLARLQSEKAALEARVAQLEQDLAFCEAQNRRLVQDASPALRENAVLRYQLFKCESDRQVLEFHIQGSRAEARAALNLLHRLAPPGAPEQVEPLEALLIILHQARSLEAWSETLAALEAKAQALWLAQHGSPWRFEPRRWLGLSLAAVLRRLEQARDAQLEKAAHPAEGLSAFDPAQAELAEGLARALEELL